MGFVDFLISKLVGYDILKSEKELKASLENAQRELSAVTSRNDKLMKEAEYRQGEIVSAQTKIEKANEEIALSKKHIERLYEDLDAKVANYKELEEKLAAYVGRKYCIGVANGTEALQLALMAMNVGPGDAVFTSDFTYFASAGCASIIGATPILVDIDLDTFNIKLPTDESRN